MPTVCAKHNVHKMPPESRNKLSGAFLFRYLFRKGKPWYTENSNSEFMEVPHYIL